MEDPNSISLSKPATKQSRWKVGAGAAGAIAGAKLLGGAGLLKSGFLFKTVITLFISLALYARLYGLAFAAVVVGLLLVHEMGHWLWMKMYKLDPGAPVFVPFVGAFVAMNKLPPDEATDAWVAFAGPLVGGIGALIVYGVGAFTSNAALMAGGNFGFFLNLLQLVPAKPLDGGFIASAISKWLLIPGTILVLLLGVLSQSVLLLVIGAASAFSLFKKKKRDAVDAFGAEPEVQMKKATGKQRFAIGAAYMGLALFLGVMQIFAQVQMLSNKDFAAAQIEYLNDQISHSPSDNDLYRERSQCYATVGKLKEAESDITQAIGSGSEDYDDYLSLARYRLAQGQVDATTGDAISKAMSLVPDNISDDWTVAYSYLLMGENDKALKAADKCDEGDKSDIQASVYYQTNKLSEARAAYDVAIKKYTTYMVGAYCQKALTELSQNELPSAKVDVEEAEQQDAEDPLTMLTRGWYQLSAGDANAAVKKADEALAEANETDNMQRRDHWQILAACHRLKADANSKLGESAKDTTAKAKFEQDAASELKTANDMSTLLLYAPVGAKATAK